MKQRVNFEDHGLFEEGSKAIRRMEELCNLIYSAGCIPVTH